MAWLGLLYGANYEINHKSTSDKDTYDKQKGEETKGGISLLVLFQVLYPCLSLSGFPSGGKFIELDEFCGE